MRWVLLLVALMFAGCGQQSEPQSAPESEIRIASLSPGITVTLIDLGLDDKIVARHGWDTAAQQALPVVGDQNGLDYEALLRAQPTHVLLQWGSRPLPDRLVELAKRRGWVVESFGSLSWDDVAAMELRLAEMFGVRDEPEPTGRQTTPLMVRLEPSKTDRTRMAALGPVVLLMPGPEPAALGPGSFHFEIASNQLGAEMAGPLDGPYVRLHAEDLVRLAPGAIVLLMPRGEHEAAGDPFEEIRWREALGRLAELGLPAVESGRVAVLDHPHSLLAGTSLVEVRSQLAGIFDHWATRADQTPTDSPGG